MQPKHVSVRMSNTPAKPSVKPQFPDDEFIRLFTGAQRQLYLFILSQVGRVQAAEEILQETNLIIWSKSEQFQPGTNFLAWARQIAVYEVLKWRQRKSRDKLQFSDEFVKVIVDEYESTHDDVERQQRALENCLQKLNAQDRELIEQRYQPGVTGKDVAKALNRPANSVYQSLGRIRKSLIECVQRQLATELR